MRETSPRFWAEQFSETTRFGELTAIALPAGDEPVPEEVLARLHPLERDFARTLRKRRQIEWVGGRLALRLACERLGLVCGPVLTGARGEPLLPEGMSASISHKRDRALALLARSGSARIGLDVEELGRARESIARRILVEDEQRAIELLPEAERWEAILGRFAVKEAVYKALHPFVERFVGFHEAEVQFDEAGRVDVRLRLSGGEGPFRVDASLRRRESMLIAEVAIDRA